MEINQSTRTTFREIKMEKLLSEMNRYFPLSEQTMAALRKICQPKSFKKNELILRAGDYAKYYYFVNTGLLGYYKLDTAGNIIYKLFFEENSFCASTAAIIEEKPSNFNIVALEDVLLMQYSARLFRELVIQHHDLALFQIAYLEKNWVVKKEPLEINLKWESAKERYLELYSNQSLFKRLKQHHIASYLGVTPTQLSRIRKELKQ
ncbi:Crp/Fnr family transcriptional regulator [Sphingobacterium athyrii]|nr:Crp/Fnr family transcriptional regulator [Sphingobacterium athyrii]